MNQINTVALGATSIGAFGNTGETAQKLYEALSSVNKHEDEFTQEYYRNQRISRLERESSAAINFFVGQIDELKAQIANLQTLAESSKR